MRDAFAQLFREDARLAVAGGRHEHREFLAAPAVESVDDADAGRNDGRQFFQDHIARFVAERIVDLLEMIDIDEQQRQGLLVSHTAVELQGDRAIKLAPVPYAGQRIRGPQSFELNVAGLQLVDLRT